MLIAPFWISCMLLHGMVLYGAGRDVVLAFFGKVMMVDVGLLL